MNPAKNNPTRTIKGFIWRYITLFKVLELLSETAETFIYLAMLRIRVRGLA
jgi:hypothetical protein